MAPKPASKVRSLSPTESGSAEISYRFMREQVIAEAKVNPILRSEMCDAHPMLLRAAKAIGEPANRLCAFCDRSELVLLRYAFGPRLPAEGRCLESSADQKRLTQKAGSFTCRVVEVCCSCSWNYMISCYTIRGSS